MENENRTRSTTNTNTNTNTNTATRNNSNPLQPTPTVAQFQQQLIGLQQQCQALQLQYQQQQQPFPLELMAFYQQQVMGLFATATTFGIPAQALLTLDNEANNNLNSTSFSHNPMFNANPTASSTALPTTNAATIAAAAAAAATLVSPNLGLAANRIVPPQTTNLAQLNAYLATENVGNTTQSAKKKRKTPGPKLESKAYQDELHMTAIPIIPSSSSSSPLTDNPIKSHSKRTSKSKHAAAATAIPIPTVIPIPNPSEIGSLDNHTKKVRIIDDPLIMSNASDPSHHASSLSPLSIPTEAPSYHQHGFNAYTTGPITVAPPSAAASSSSSSSRQARSSELVPESIVRRIIPASANVSPPAKAFLEKALQDFICLIAAEAELMALKRGSPAGEITHQDIIGALGYLGFQEYASVCENLVKQTRVKDKLTKKPNSTASVANGIVDDAEVKISRTPSVRFQRPRSARCMFRLKVYLSLKKANPNIDKETVNRITEERWKVIDPKEKTVCHFVCTGHILSHLPSHPVIQREMYKQGLIIFSSPLITHNSSWKRKPLVSAQNTKRRCEPIANR